MIVTMANEGTAGAYCLIDAGASYSSTFTKEKPIIMAESFAGLVVGTGEHNWHDDSDFYAIVWNEEKGEPVEVCYASTRGWTYPNYATVDATPEVAAKYAAYVAAAEAAARALRAERRARSVEKWKEVKVVRGRKVPLGTVGEVFWKGPNKFSRTGANNVGLRLLDGSRVFTAESNVEVMNFEKYLAA